MSLNVFVKIDMSGAKSKAFQANNSTTIKDLKQMILDREGHDLETLMYRAKPCRDHFTLADINFQTNGTFFASLRLIGGAQASEGSNATQFDKHKVQSLAAKHGASVVTDNCILGNSDGCTESMIYKCKFSCGCVYCPDCFKQSIKSQITKIQINGSITIDCGWSSHADKSKAKVVDTGLALAVCAYDENKINEISEQIDKNALRKPQSFMKDCFKCGKFMIKKGLNDSLVEQCPSCKVMMCWICRGEPHKDPMDCIDVASIASIINMGKDKEISGQIVWDRRVCINKDCREVNVHKSACRHITCRCGAQYCHWCLQDWKKHNGTYCSVKGKENITAKYLFVSFIIFP
eukprot:346922_1